MTVATQPPSRVWCLWQLARTASFMGFNRLGLAVWMNLRAHDRHRAQALAYLAYTRAESGRYRAALLWQKRLVQSHPETSSAWFNLGYLQEQLGLLDQAVYAFGRAVELQPSLDQGWFGLGGSLRRLERFFEAIEALQKNVALQPWSPHGYRELAYAHAGLGQWNEVRRLIRHLDGFEPRVALELEQLYQDRLGDGGEAP